MGGGVHSSVNEVVRFNEAISRRHVQFNQRVPEPGTGEPRNLPVLPAR